jgi:dienelactone hydrolase
MIHDVWGLSAHTRDYATRLANEGFAVLAIDLYRRARPEEDRGPRALHARALDPQVLATSASGALLAALPESNGRRRVLGFLLMGDCTR